MQICDLKVFDEVKLFSTYQSIYSVFEERIQHFMCEHTNGLIQALKHQYNPDFGEKSVYSQKLELLLS